MSRSTTAPRKATNLSLDGDLLDVAKSLGINVSRACESGLAEQIAATRRERWLADNREAIESSNRYVEEHGLPLARFRQF